MQHITTNAQSYLDHVLYPAVRVWLDDGLHPDERLDVRGESVGHQVELPVRRYEGDRTIVLEASQSHAPIPIKVTSRRRGARKTRARMGGAPRDNWHGKSHQEDDGNGSMCPFRRRFVTSLPIPVVSWRYSRLATHWGGYMCKS